MQDVTMHAFSENIVQKIKDESVRFQQLTSEINKVIVGHQENITFIMLALLSNGHILLEGVPGIAKTTLIKTLAKALGLSFKRIQFTPDLLPADLIGTSMFNAKMQEFEIKKGPIFANLVLADEINRTPAKVQSALLEAMQEHQVTIGSHTFILDEPFVVCATQNPIEQEGTYRLPEAQIDRFMFKLLVNYPSLGEEKEMLQRVFNPYEVHQVLTQQAIVEAQALVKKIYLNEKVVDYIVSIVFATRNPEAYNLASLKNLIQCGASPRATLNLHRASRAYAFLKGRNFVIPDDVKAVCYGVLRHRIALSYEAEASNVHSDQVIRAILHALPSP
jgi:MoxR-like ATPase